MSDTEPTDEELAKTIDDAVEALTYLSDLSAADPDSFAQAIDILTKDQLRAGLGMACIALRLRDDEKAEQQLMLERLREGLPE